MDNNTKYGYVYLLEDPSASSIKIGFTSDLDGRVRNLQIGSSSILKLVCVWFCPRSYERVAHNLLQKYKKHSEWFECDAAFAIDRISSAFGMPHYCRNHRPTIYRIANPKLSRWQDIRAGDLAEVLVDLKAVALKMSQHVSCVEDDSLNYLCRAVRSVQALDNGDPLQLAYIMRAALDLVRHHPDSVIAHNAFAISRVLPAAYQATRKSKN